MKGVKKIYKCTDCTDGPCFCITPVEWVPRYCIGDDNSESVVDGEEAPTGDAYTEPVNWLQEETLYQDKGFSPEIFKEILDA